MGIILVFDMVQKQASEHALGKGFDIILALGMTSPVLDRKVSDFAFEFAKADRQNGSDFARKRSHTK